MNFPHATVQQACCGIFERSRAMKQPCNVQKAKHAIVTCMWPLCSCWTKSSRSVRLPPQECAKAETNTGIRCLHKLHATIALAGQSCQSAQTYRTLRHPKFQMSPHSWVVILGGAVFTSSWDEWGRFLTHLCIVPQAVASGLLTNLVSFQFRFSRLCRHAFLTEQPCWHIW